MARSASWRGCGGRDMRVCRLILVAQGKWQPTSIGCDDMPVQLLGARLRTLA